MPRLIKDQLKRRIDDIQKDELTKDDIQFLKELQTELNEQDNEGMPNPKYWVIRTEKWELDYDACPGSDKTIVVQGGYYEDALEFMLKDDGTYSMAPECETGKEFLQLMKDATKSCDCESEKVVNWYIRNGDIMITVADETTDDRDLATYLRHEGCEYNNSVIIGEGENELSFTSQTAVWRVVPNTVFITRQAAEQHLKENHYHYSDNAHAYGMCAWRSPEFERLLDIVSKTKW